MGTLAGKHHHDLENTQHWAWKRQLLILRSTLGMLKEGRVFLEMYIPRMGKRADAVLVFGNRVFVIEFKVGSKCHHVAGLDQVLDYALDLKNFHEGSRDACLIPILVSTDAPSLPISILEFYDDGIAKPIATNSADLGNLLRKMFLDDYPVPLDVSEWKSKGYKPTPTIVEAAQVLYQTHSVTDISRSDSGAKNLRETSDKVLAIIDESRRTGTKAICFVTGVPGSGKTLAGLNVATRRVDEHQDEKTVFLSGNGPLVDVLREALARDVAKKNKLSKGTAEREVRSFIQNIHHFRDEYVGNQEVPAENVVIFDEAQRAWTQHQASSFMQRKRGQTDFNMSEPEFLIGVMDRHQGWCAIVCLVGGGQEINTGEGGICGWLSALDNRFGTWNIYVSQQINLPVYSGTDRPVQILSSPRVSIENDLHLEVSMRSFRSERFSDFVDCVLDGDSAAAKARYESLKAAYPVFLTRDLGAARNWLRQRSRGTERIGLVASSGAQRLRPFGVHIKAKVDPVLWFLNDLTDVRSSYYLEEVASEFDVQGLELDWAGVCWDGDLYHDGKQWVSQAFKGCRWQRVKAESRRLYLKNAYRVNLTRARQGLVIFVPEGSLSDSTRPRDFYDGTFAYLRSCGLPSL